ncbi:MAG: 3-deoxy-7-phosphoheptulonate synthase [Candidatus Diapherotrites archaeon]|uniref:3-deoxy-7-phosphoheptulonate synthase n=1 Tax=Candidatus Iainarchaeum sp. TaxID=3101447 RepID=A0A8T4L2X1_9ARCH|nr:3-deoxy-7-phosphoheptulonate synthase [Candidatus Diapherotrites archaeon]
MIIVMKKGSTQKDVDKVLNFLEKNGLSGHVSKGVRITVIGGIGTDTPLVKERVEELSEVEKVIPILKPYKLVSREAQPENTVIDVDGIKIGGNEIVTIAGPCAIESEEQLMTTAASLKKAGVKILRASAYKPRTSPYAFQGMEEDGLKLLAKVKEEFGLAVETEVMDTRRVELVSKYVDVLRIGARNMQNFNLLKEVGKVDKPIILKRGISATIEEFLLAAEYILKEGNKQVILCERGIRTFETSTRNTIDITSVPVVKAASHLPIIVDPSHAAGRKELVGPIAKAAVAVGADGLLIEVHCDPENALCDGKQALTPGEFSKLMVDLRKIASAIGRKM